MQIRLTRMLAAILLWFFRMRKPQDLALGEKIPKFLTTVMRLTDFVTLYSLVKDDLGVESFWAVVEQLACYSNELQESKMNITSEFLIILSI